MITTVDHKNLLLRSGNNIISAMTLFGAHRDKIFDQPVDYHIADFAEINGCIFRDVGTIYCSGCALFCNCLIENCDGVVIYGRGNGYFGNAYYNVKFVTFQ